MSIILKRISVGNFIADYVCPPDTLDSFKIYALIEKNKNTTFNDINALNRADKIAARQSFIKFYKKAVIGMPFRELFDGNQYHTGHEFTYQKSPVTIWRLWLVGDIRIYILFLSNHRIVVLKTIAKRVDDLTKNEKKVLADITKRVINCDKKGLVNIK